MRLAQRILVVVPHPDDEVLLAGGVIHRAVIENKDIFVAVATNGDYLCSDSSKGEKRLAESMAALNYLGVSKNNVFFLGYPDTGMEPEVSFLSALKNDDTEEKLFPSARGAQTYGIANVKEDFAYEQRGSHSLYCANAFKQDLKLLMEVTAPDLVITTAQHDMHGDHDALSFFVRQAVKAYNKEKARAVSLWEGFVHSTAGDDKWPIVTEDMPELTMPYNLMQCTCFNWEDRISVKLPQDMLCEKASDSMKYKAIKLYKSALDPNEPLVCDYLLAFAKQDEVFWKIL